MKLTKFKVVTHGDRWMSIGYTSDGDEVWSDGCCVDNKRLAEAICRNMVLAYKQGIEDCATSINQVVKDDVTRLLSESKIWNS